MSGSHVTVSRATVAILVTLGVSGAIAGPFLSQSQQY